ncbi:ABC transporter ATP-binding protein [Aestuariimicrobium kwangyangense]|uniref:ABC transporter ATP-binding protein n=1 Tax=Aestuariimicrobium kwangyangense TaxID=396389 RepID=UPI0003B418BE|nr:ATP-binding cassette domain-containing protein [Aestuariimicrobium kwangyangense]
MSEGGAAVVTSGLTKTFGHQTAVDDLALEVPTGSVYGFLGPNGSGKTTTIRMLLGLVHPTAGHVRLLDEPMPAHANRVLPRVGALVEGPAFHLHLNGRDNLRRLDAADATAEARTSSARIGAALERVGLTAAARKRVKNYSLGMKQRLGIAAALLQPHDLLVLDEPTNGLDPQGTREVRHLVAGLAHDGTTVLVSSHLLAEVEQMCSHVGVMSRGRLVAQDSLAGLRRAHGVRVRVTTPDLAQATDALTVLGLDEVASSAGEGASGQVTAALGDHAVEAVVPALVSAGVRVLGFSADSASLEERFVELTGEGFDVR